MTMSKPKPELSAVPDARPEHKVRLVTAAALFDGHDAAINIMRRIIQDTGVEVIHLGHNRSVQEIVDAAIEDIRQMYATTENVEREAQEGDYILLDVKSETTELNRTGFAALIRKEERDTESPDEVKRASRHESAL